MTEHALPSNSLRHVVLLAFKPAAPVQELIEAFRKLAATIPEVMAFEQGSDVSTEKLAQGYTHAFTLSFADTAGRDHYLVHPAHQAFVALVTPWVAQVLVLDYLAKA